MLSISFCPAFTHAQADATNTVAARQIGFAGVQAYQSGDYPGALDKLERAYALAQVPTLGLWSARTLVKLGRYVSASERYLEVTRLPVPAANRVNHEKAQADALAERNALLPKIPSLRVDLKGAPVAEVELTVGGQRLASALVGVASPSDPGVHKIVGVWRGRERVATVTLADGDEETVVLDFEPPRAVASPGSSPPAARASPRASTPVRAQSQEPGARPQDASGSGSTWAYVSLSVGGAGVALGAVTGLVALNQKRSLDDGDTCRDGECLPQSHQDVDSLNTWRTVSTAGFAVGVVGVGVGLTLLLTGETSEDAKPSQGTAHVVVGPGRVGVAGRF